jgi:hypothetical protein
MTLGSARPRLVATLFTAAVFLNAALLFAVQPMFSKMVLPSLGGSPAVWNTCMLFFQTALLAGYLYSHVATNRVPVRVHAPAHVVLLALSALALPIGIASGLGAPPEGAPIIWLVGLLTVSLGAPFLMLSTGAPLLQRWFSRTGHPDAANPYFLYAASNLGSMVSLLAYPLLLEPKLPLAAQSMAWTVAYVILIAMIGACAVIARRGNESVEPAAPAPAGAEPNGAVTAGRRLRWIALAFVPSSMLLGVTTYLSTDVAAIPMLWIAPLALYLLTFVLAFSGHVWFRPPLLLALQAVFLVWLTMTMAIDLSGLVAVMAPAHLAGLFLSGMICHTALSNDRPPVNRLTEFYLWISVGGMLGGLFNALIAPHLFDSVAEYPIAIVLAAAMRPLTSKSVRKQSRVLDFLLPSALGVAVVMLLRNGFPVPGMSVRASLAAFAACALACLAFQRRPIRFALGIAVIFLGAATGLARNEQLLYRTRSFFGVHKVVRLEHVRALQHSSTIHGAQSSRTEELLEPLTYYHRRSPIAQVFDTLMLDVPLRRVGIIGLGSGSLACYGRKGESWTFFEIDPAVEAIARTPEYFTFLRDCPPATRVVIGDGRLTLNQQADSTFDLVVIDAFGSDAIPAHLLTREALALYTRKLRPNGVVAFHISNRYLDLEPVVAEIARSLGATALTGSDSYLSNEARGPYRSLSKWVVVSASPATVAPLAKLEGWSQARGRPGMLWTDDFSNVLGVFRWQRQ